METKHCKHLTDSIGINRDFIKAKKNGLNIFNLECLECGDRLDEWMCLKCGENFCSRSIHQHAEKHFKSTKHKISISLNTSACYCYECDEFVDNEFDLSEIRQEINSANQDAASDSETSLNLEETKSLIASGENQETVSTSSCDSGLESLHSGVNLRPRKRTKSPDDTESLKSSKRKSQATGKRKGVGLKNLGNTCFMNSVLQSLHNIQQFTYYFSNLPKIEQPKPRPYYSRSIKENLDDIFLVEELRKVLNDLNGAADQSKSSISPECLFLVIWKVVPTFKGYHQHDAHEFLRYMLDRLHTELLNVTGSLPQTPTTSKMKNFICQSPVKNSSSSFVTRIFEGTLLSEVRCLVCGQESKKHDPFLDLSLDIPEKYYKEVDDTDKKSLPICNISDCLSSFVSIEELTEAEFYHCSNCKKKQRSTKRFWIRRLPNVLCLHIKRFKWNQYYRTKIDLRIHFPIKAFDLSKYVLNSGPETRRSNSSSVYDLAAVIVHHGTGTSNGHYTAYAYHNSTWVHFNDTSVKEVSEDIVASCKPYILFYSKRDSEINDLSN